MVNLYIRTFINKNADPKDKRVRKKYANLASVTGIAVNLILFAVKLFVGLLSASVAVIADAFNNISDAGSSVITFIGFRLSEKPVDKDHPWGHGRFEYVTGFIVDMIIILVGAELLKSSVEKIVEPELPSIGTITFVLLGVAVLVKFWLFFFYRKIGKTISSQAILATASDSISDVLSTTLVLVSAIVAKIWEIPVDGWAGVIVACFILYTGLRSAKETVDILLGQPPEKEFVDGIYDFVKNYPEIVGIHDVMVHDYGPGRRFVSFHAEVPADADICLAHDVIDKMEQDMFREFGCIVTVHMDPLEVDNEKVNELREEIVRTVRSVWEGLSIHDFRLTDGGLHTNVIFDLVVPTDCPLKKEEAKTEVEKRIKESHVDFNCVILAEHPYV